MWWRIAHELPRLKRNEDGKWIGEFEEKNLYTWKIKDTYAKNKKVNFGGDAAQALSKEVERLIDRAAERAKANRRSTIKGRDI